MFFLLKTLTKCSFILVTLGLWLNTCQGQVISTESKGENFLLEEQAGIWLDIATHYCEQGQIEEAKGILNIIELEFSPPPGIMQVILYLKNGGCIEKRSAKFKLTGHTGWINNVNQGPSTNFITLGYNQLQLELSPNMRPKQDHFLGIEAEWLINQSLDRSWQWSALAYTRQYQQEHNYNQQLLGTQINKNFRWFDWSGQWQSGFSSSQLGNQHFQDSIYTSLLAQKNNWFFETITTLQRFTKYSQYNSEQIIQRIGYIWTLRPDWQIRTRAQYTLDHASQNRPGGNRQGFGTELTNSYLIHEQLKWETSLRHDQSRSSTAYSPGLFNQTRHQRWTELRTGFLYILNNQESLQAQIIHHDVKDQVPILAFRQTSFQLSWTYLFR